MPKLNGIEATKRIKNNDESVKIIGLSEYLEKIPVIRMLKAGALGYLLKSCVFENLLTAIEKVSQGKYFLSPEISNFVVDDYLMESEQTDPDKKKTLTERDCRIIQMLSEGKTNKQIALELGLNPKTTDACKRNIMNKLEIYSIAELTKFAVQQGLTPLAV
jgi:DNA-binding NarL/FixJ family response regulator